MTVTAVEVAVVFPAPSTAVPVIVWFAPSVLTVTGAGQLAIPLVRSEQVKLTTTSALYQPVSLHEHHWLRVTTDSWKSGSTYGIQSHSAMSYVS